MARDILDWVTSEHRIDIHGRTSTSPVSWFWTCSCKAGGAVMKTEEKAIHGAKLHQKDMALGRAQAVMSALKHETERQRVADEEAAAIASIEETIRGHAEPTQ